jgi:hypothetical protein
MKRGNTEKRKYWGKRIGRPFFCNYRSNADWEVENEKRLERWIDTAAKLVVDWFVAKYGFDSKRIFDNRQVYQSELSNKPICRKCSLCGDYNNKGYAMIDLDSEYLPFPVPEQCEYLTRLSVVCQEKFEAWKAVK